MVQLSIVICTYKRLELLSDVLCSFDPDSQDFELIVVIDKDDIQTAEFVELKFPHVKLVESSGGLSEARNDGFAESVGSLIAYLDDDIIVPDKWIFHLLRGFRKYPDAEILGGPVLLSNEVELPWWMPDSNPGVPLINFGKDSKIINFPEEKLIGANIAFQREFLERVGKFPTGVGRRYNNLWGGEETVIQTYANKIAYLPRIKVYHKIPEIRLQIPTILRYYFSMGRADTRHYASGTLEMAEEGRSIENFALSTVNKIREVKWNMNLSNLLMCIFWLSYAIGYFYEKLVAE